MPFWVRAVSPLGQLQLLVQIKEEEELETAGYLLVLPSDGNRLVNHKRLLVFPSSMPFEGLSVSPGNVHSVTKSRGDHDDIKIRCHKGTEIRHQKATKSP